MTAPDLSHRFEAESVGRALELVGERWTLLILREAFFGVQRFGQLARNLSIPRPTLSSRLRMLVNVGLLDRVLYSRDPERHEYRLTDAAAISSERSSSSCSGGRALAAPRRAADCVAPQHLRRVRRSAPGLRTLRRRDHRAKCDTRSRAGLPHHAGIAHLTLPLPGRYRPKLVTLDDPKKKGR